MRFIWLMVILTLLPATGAMADPVTLACTLRDTTTYSTRYIEVDQIVFDVENESVDIRSGKTVGTNDLVNWIFVTRKDNIFDDRFTVRGGANWFFGGGLYGAYPYAMRLTSGGLFTMTYVDGDTPEVIRWRCQM